MGGQQAIFAGRSAVPADDAVAATKAEPISERRFNDGDLRTGVEEELEAADAADADSRLEPEHLTWFLQVSGCICSNTCHSADLSSDRQSSVTG